MDIRKSLKFKLKTCEDNLWSEELERQLENIDGQISDECAEENYQKVKDNFECMSGKNCRLNCNGMRNVTKKVFPKNIQPLPVGKKNELGKIVTKPESTKLVYAASAELFTTAAHL